MNGGPSRSFSDSLRLARRTGVSGEFAEPSFLDIRLFDRLVR
jgi:hypothetical protein